MKGFILYEDYRGKYVVEAVRLGMVNYERISDTSEGNWINNLSGIRKESTQAKCNESDTYDFETGALIALMKMCGVEKVVRACNEAFSEDTFKTYATKYERELNELKKDFDKVKDLKDFYKKNYDRLKEEYVAIRTENEKLKLDCEKLQHGYIDTDTIFCGGRQNGKQYTFLVDLFKKLDQKKVDAAYKEAYNTNLPLWQKEALRQVYEIHKESKEKIELPRTLDINDGPPTKREEMWNEIFALHKEKHPIIVVKKEDVNTFLHEGVKIFEAKGTIRDIYIELKRCDTIYFRLQKSNKLSYSTDPYIYPYYDFEHIPYLPPMRWDLFKKGRRIIRVRPEYLEEFMTICSNKLGGMMMPNLKRYKEFTHVFVVISDYHYDNKATVHIMSPEDLVRNQHENPKKYSDKKIVDWEDVR